MRSSRPFLASCFVAAVHAADLFQIGVITGNGEKASIIASLNQLERTYRSTNMGYGASVDEPGVYCKAFSDPHGRDPLGDTFATDDAVSFAELDSDPVRIGSFYCSDSEDVLGPGERPSQAGNGGNGGGSGGGDDGDGGDSGVKVQFRTDFNSFTKGNVPLGKLFSLEDSDLGDSVVEAMVVSYDDLHVKCQLLGGQDGKEKLGRFSKHSVTLGIEPVTAKSIICTEGDN